MPAQHPRDQFSEALLSDAAPAEAQLYATYADAVTRGPEAARGGVGLGIPPELMGALGVAVVVTGHLVYDLIIDWAKDVVGEILKKYVVETGVAKLKEWLGTPKQNDLGNVLTADGKLAIMSVVEREALVAKLSADDTKALKDAVIKRLGL